MTTKKQKEDRQSAIESLRAFLKPGDTVTTTVMHVSRSGMSRVIMCQAVGMQDGKPYIRDISWLVSRAVGYPLDEKNGGVKIGGCGMNMCFALVYELGSVLFPDGFAPSDMATNPSKGITEPRCINVGRGMKRCAAIPFALDRAWVEAKHKAGWLFTRGRNGDRSGWDTSGGYALKHT